MRISKHFIAACSALALGGAALFGAAPAWAYVACNSNGDCWHTGSKSLDWSGVILKYHDDDWWDAHKGDAEFHFHDSDAEHNWQRGYWSKGTWRGGF
jgi:hypothetical protein